MDGLTERLEEMYLKGELFDYCLPERFAMNILFNFTYSGTGLHTQRNTIFNSRVEEWILENIDKVYIDADYHHAKDGRYDNIPRSIVVLYFSSKEDLMAFKLRWA